MAKVFGAVAREYDSVRPGYPAAELAAAILDFYGGTPSSIVELGSGTGKGTEVLALLDTPLTCVEPDARMGEVLAERFPQAQVVISTFEDWQAPPGGAPMITCALAWHWLDPATRNQRTRQALQPGGVLAVFGHQYGFVDQAQSDAINDVFRDLGQFHQDEPENWFHDDIVASGQWTEVTSQAFGRRIDFDTERYLLLQRTFSPSLLRPQALQQKVQDGLREAIDASGGVVAMNLRTTLVLARRD